MKQARWLTALGLVACGTTSTALQRAATARTQGDKVGAYAILASATCSHEGNWDTGRALVEAWDDLGRPASPLDRLGDCAMAPGLRPYIDGLARALLGQYEAAEQALANAAAATPNDFEPVYRQGLVVLAAKRYDSAKPLLTRAVAAWPARVDVRLALAQAQQGQPAEAVETLTGILQLTPSAPELRRARQILQAVVHASLPPLDDATETTLRTLLGAAERGVAGSDELHQARLIADNTGHPRAMTVAGILTLRAGDETEARRLLGLAAEAAPFDPDPVRALGSTLYTGDRPLEALPYLKQAASRDPFDVELEVMLAATATSRGDTITARDAQRRLTVLEPTNTEHHLWLARLERQRGDLGAARAAIEQGCRVMPRDVPLLVERASIEAQSYLQATNSGDRSQARSRTKKAIAALLLVAPDHPAAHPILESIGERM